MNRPFAPLLRLAGTTVAAFLWRSSATGVRAESSRNFWFSVPMAGVSLGALPTAGVQSVRVQPLGIGVSVAMLGGILDLVPRVERKTFDPIAARG